MVLALCSFVILVGTLMVKEDAAFVVVLLTIVGTLGCLVFLERVLVEDMIGTGAEFVYCSSALIFIVLV